MIELSGDDDITDKLFLQCCHSHTLDALSNLGLVQMESVLMRELQLSEVIVV